MTTLTENKPFPYQEEDIQELTDRPRIILGSVMRAGKMIETFELVKRLDLENVLVIAPKPVVPEWEYKIDIWLGPEWRKRFDIYNYEKLRNVNFTSLVQQAGYQLMVLDEAHKVKNRQAHRTKGAHLIASWAPRLILATGTPIENHPGDAWSLLHMIDPVAFPSYWKFVEHFCIVQQLPKPPFPRIIVGPKNTEEFRALLHKYMLRRERYELKDHDGKLIVMDRAPIRTIPVELTDAQLLHYESMEDQLFTMLENGEKISSPNVLAQRLRLRQICLEPNLLASLREDKVSTPSAKTQVVMELVEDANSPIVIVTFFEQYARILTNEIRKAGYTVAEYSGAPDIVPQRHQIVMDFQAGKYDVLVGTIGSIGLGLTLTASHDVVFTDLWYNPQVNNQVTSRFEGAGPPRQTEPVQVMELWAKGTIEDSLHIVLNRKERMFRDTVVTEEEVWQQTLDARRRARDATY